MKTKYSPDYAGIELLESRIAPAAMVHFIDVDGDAVTIKTSKGTTADLMAVVMTSVPPGAVPGGVQIDNISLTFIAVFDGTDLSVTAKPGPLGGDGLVNVAIINATSQNLGTVTVQGDLRTLAAGKNLPGSKIKTINVNSTSGVGVWTLHGSVGAINVTHDLRGAQIEMNDAGATLGALNIGGSLIGETGFKTGFVSVANGTIGKVAIKGDIQGGGTSANAGVITARDILSATIGGSILGGSGADSGKITVTESLGSLTVKGDVRGGTNTNSGLIHSTAMLGNVSIGGSLVGGTMGHSGNVEGAMGIGKVTIGRDEQGGDASDTGDIQSGGGIAAVTIGGSVIGGTASFSGRIIAQGGNIGPIKIGGDLQSGGRDSSGTLLTDAGIILAEIGGFNDAPKAKIASVTIGGSVVGYGTCVNPQVSADDTIGPVKVGRDVRGGPGQFSAYIYGYDGIASLAIGGSLIGGTGNNSGYIASNTGGIGAVKIGGSIIGNVNASGSISSNGRIGDVTIGGDLLGTTAAVFLTSGSMGAVKIAGSVINSFIEGEPAVGSQLAIKSVTIGGRMDGSTIATGNADGQIGPVKVAGDWVASQLRTGVDAGVDGLLGTDDDMPQAGGDAALFSKIASITFAGQVLGTSVGGDHFGFVSEEIGAMSVHGVKIPLKSGHSNDTDATNTHFILGTTRDVTVHEIA